MRRTLALAGLAVGIAAAVLPVASASAQCQPPLIDNGKPCADDGCDYYAALDARLGGRLPDDLVQCTQ